MNFGLANLATVMKKELMCVIILSFFIFLSSKALLHEGFFRTIDDITTVRIDYMERELKRNDWSNFPVRLSGELSNNYGYPLYLFYAPLTYYFGAILKMLLSLSSIVATKYVYVFPLIFGPFAFYFAARQKMSHFPALTAAIVYTLFPYRGTNTYLRGAVAEAWAIAFVPLALGALFLLQKKNKFGGVLFSISLFLVLISHNLTGVLFTGFVLLYALVFFQTNKQFWRFLILGLGMAAFYLIPMFYYLKIIKVSYLDLNTTYIFQTLEPISNLLVIKFNQMVWRTSGVFVLILAGGLMHFIYKKLKGEKKLNEPLFWGLSGLVLYLLLFEPAIYIWKLTSPATGILQFVWRLLSILAFIIPFFLGLLLAHIKSLYLKIALVSITIIASINFLPSFKPEAYSYFYEYKPEGQCASTSNQDEYLPIWVKGCPPRKVL